LLQRLLAAVHLVFVLQGGCGLRLVSLFLRLSRLDRVLAASFGACQKRQARLEQLVNDFAGQQRQQLAAPMPPREIAVAEDETYRPGLCLVALEPVSGFLLVERHAQRRDQASWDQALREGLHGLPVTVRQVVSDQAKGLLAHARHGLGVPHSPDLFHAQHELSRAVGPALAAQTRKAQDWSAKAEGLLREALDAQQAAASKPRPPGRPVDHAAKVAEARRWLAGCQGYQARCEGRHEQWRAALRGLGEDDHPFDLASGQPAQAEQVRHQLEGRLQAAAQLAAQAKVQAKAGPALGKVRRLLPGLVAAVAFFWVRLQAALVQRYGEGAQEWVVPLVAAGYLGRVAGQVKGAARRQQVRAVAAACRERARQSCPGEPAGGWQEAERQCREWSGWFVRSSSAVEGRNGQLSLRQHGLHRLSARKLGALTALHNYWIRRGDGTTAAERFFGQKPADLFEWLLERLPEPARPAARRVKAA
jgi:hypothetical protein